MSSNPLPNNDLVVISTVSLVLDAMLNNLEFISPETNYVYDEALSYESSVTAYRSNNREIDAKIGLFPLFSFKRSVLKYNEPAGPGQRSKVINSKRQVSSGKTQDIKFLDAMIEVDFIYYTKSIEDMENFEVQYLSSEGISSQKILTVDYTSFLGTTQNYYATFGPLNEKTIRVDDNYYKALTGKISIRGIYYLIKGSSSHILSIRERIFSFYKGVNIDPVLLDTVVIIPKV